MSDATSPWPLLLILFLLFVSPSIVDSSDEAELLLKFKATLSSGGGNSVLRNWVAGTAPCRANVPRWTGVICQNGAVLGVQFEDAGLSGELNVDSLVGLQHLRILSFMNNSFTGRIPDIAKIPALRSVYLSNNKFSGEIPDSMFTAFGRLKKVYLSVNEFSGNIPSSLTKLPMLMELSLDSNKFDGPIPDFQQEGLYLFNVSYNGLQGSIPAGLCKINATMFAGNQDLCGLPLTVPCKPLSSKPKKLSPFIIVAIVLLVISGLLAVVGLLFFFTVRRKKEVPMTQPQPNQSKQMDHLEAEKMKHTPVERHGGGKVSKEEQGKLIFVKEGRGNFGLEDLLRASAEVLGSGNFGSSYKAVMFDGPYMVVKRFKEMNGVGREDFSEHMRRLRRLSHPNLLPLVAYYYRKDEKLLVTDYIPNGSLAHMLHGNRGNTKLPPLAWPTRLKIVKGIVRGLEYLYEELPMMMVPHGHLKSSNVLLDYSFEPKLSDYALLPVMNQAHASQVMVAFKSPECEYQGKPSKNSDVWSLGILILEILTGKFPANYLRQGRSEPDLLSWVNSVITKEWNEEVFDSNMSATENAREEMSKLLQIGMACCEADVNKRFEIGVVFEKIEALKEMDSIKEDFI